LLADDHLVVRQGLRALLSTHSEIEVIAEAGDGREAVRLAIAERPDVAVMDISMPLLNGIEATQQIISAAPEVSVVILSMHGDEEYIRRSLRAGAMGYVLKQSADTELIMAIQAAHRGESFLTPSIAGTVITGYLERAESSTTQGQYQLLTEREREVLQLTAEGKTIKEIAEILHISPRTASTHKTNLMEKLEIHHTAGLVQYAISQGIISLSNR